MERLNKRVYSAKQTVITSENLNEIQDCIIDLQDTASDMSADMVNYATTLSLSMDSQTYVLSLKLKNKNGEELASATVDLPIESMVMAASYDAANKKLILTLQSGSKLEVPLADLIAGLVPDMRTINSKRLNANIVLYASDIALSSSNSKKLDKAIEDLGNEKINRDGDTVFVIGTDSNGIYYEEVES